ncbi:unnamed protein product [Phytophthora fragariaefolia]|uniref:Unnamed protein product n=1 Tax=Phytophthora fragariaefolia TaxID=1490495 RepID=A0A9W6XJI0_9STRA|nr:unnamed protein product [Phytophthora fragariaefolia]
MEAILVDSGGNGFKLPRVGKHVAANGRMPLSVKVSEEAVMNGNKRVTKSGLVSIPHPSGQKVSQTATAARGESSKGRMSVNLFSAAASGLQGLLGLDDDDDDDDDDDILAQELTFPPPVERGNVRRRGGSRPGKSANTKSETIRRAMNAS